MKYWREPLDTDEIAISRGKVVIITERCKGCGYCIEFCPREVLAFSKEYNKKGYHPPVVVNDDCLNCHYCELLCPEFAIYSIEDPLLLETSSPESGLAPADQHHEK